MSDFIFSFLIFFCCVGGAGGIFGSWIFYKEHKLRHLIRSNIKPLAVYLMQKHFRDIKQEAPRRHTIMIYDDIGPLKYVVWDAPWITTARIKGNVYAFSHDKPWSTLNEAFDLFRSVPNVTTYAGGVICLESNVRLKVRAHRISPAEALWHTVFFSHPDTTLSHRIVWYSWIYGQVHSLPMRKIRQVEREEMERKHHE